ncbi:hypothetical protein Tco_0208233, partial [Tanacetum coccineum]
MGAAGDGGGGRAGGGRPCRGGPSWRASCGGGGRACRGGRGGGDGLVAVRAVGGRPGVAVAGGPAVVAGGVAVRGGPAVGVVGSGGGGGVGVFDPYPLKGRMSFSIFGRTRSNLSTV